MTTQYTNIASLQRSLQKPVTLVGLMAVGKSSIGQRLARRLGVTFIDSDTEITRQTGQTVSTLFQTRGEAAFRQLERETIQNLLALDQPCILATGGGAFIDPQTRHLLLHHTWVVWLQADIDTLVTRIKHTHTRPLLKTGDPRQILSKLLQERTPAYQEAQIHIMGDPQSIDRTVDIILTSLAQHIGLL